MRIALIAAALAMLAAFPYLAGGDLRSFINLDDDVYVFANPAVLRGVTGEGVRWAFTSFHAGNWHPLTWLSHMLDVSLYGTAARGHHLTSVVLHTANTALLFLACVRLTGVVWASGLAAALFGLHPLRVESVAWVAERKDVLSGLFFMLALLAYERFARRGGTGRYLLVVVLMALGLMAKPMLVTMPFALLLLDFWPLGRMRAAAAGGGSAEERAALRRLVIEKLPLFGLCAVSGAVTFLAQSAGAAVRGLTIYSPVLRLTNALVAYAGYLGKTLWPSSLAIFYPHPLAVPPWWKLAGAFLLLALVTLIAVRSRKRRPHLAVGWLWFLGLLLPVIGLVQVGAQAMADRYTYLPTIGLSLLLAWSVPAAPRAHPLPRMAAAGAAALLGALLVMSVVQAGRWRNGETLYRHTLAVTSGNWLIHNNLANILYNSERYEEAVPHYQETLRWRPNYAAALQNLGITLTHLGRFDEALALFAKALEVEPDNPDILDNLGYTLIQAGRPAEAIPPLERALRLRPGNTRVLFNLQFARAAVSRSGVKAAPTEDVRAR
jgi:tetratricopeptide (TPR) repeat protein